VSYLWVAEEHRGKSIGAAMLKVFEKNAIDAGCKIAFLSSHSFQSPGFYKRMGYEEQASVQDYPIGHADVFFARRLASNAAWLFVQADRYAGFRSHRTINECEAFFLPEDALTKRSRRSTMGR
jgi:ribosomal protein S18 acetylase RimI-like enzyme